MEIHQGTPEDVVNWRVDWNAISITEVYIKAREYAEKHHTSDLAYFQNLKKEHVTPELFWREYLWGLYTSGFRASVVSQLFPRIEKAYGAWNRVYATEMEEEVLKVIANHRKFEAAIRVRRTLQELGWDTFRKRFLQDVDTMTGLPYVGNITKYHLARNLGFDVAKPDLHLWRLANKFDFDTPGRMCAALAQQTGDRIGVVDFCLWAWSAAVGTTELA